MSLLEQNKLVPCPKFAEESWKRTRPDIFFLPNTEVLNFHGENAMENKNKLNPWKVSFRSFHHLEPVLKKLETLFGEEGLELLKQESKRLVVVNMNHGLADVYMSEDLKSHIEFMSTPNEGKPLVEQSPISVAITSRNKVSSSHKLKITVSTWGNEIPFFVVINHLDANYSQSYSVLDFILQQNSKADFLMVEGGSPFSFFRHHITLEENTTCNEFWIHPKSDHAKKTTYLEREVTLGENSKFFDLQFFLPKGHLRVNSLLHLKGNKSLSKTGGIVLANEGNFDYEPVQEHRGKSTESVLNLKMILDKKARASFQGLISAKKEAEKCLAQQINKNILLASTVRVDAEPRLDILPHDIHCKHGSASGEIDSKQLYYLQSRGFSQEQARAFILKGFALSVFDFLEEENSLQKLAEQTLHNLLPKVTNNDVP